MKIPPETTVFTLDLAKIEALTLEPEEAFVLTRVDGRTTLKQIAQIVGYDVARVWKLLSRAVDAGILEAKETPEVGRASKAKPAADGILEQLNREDRDPVLSKIPRARRSEILARHRVMANQNHYEVLGVESSATLDQIRTAYFGLVKNIHPDRFFGKELGPYKSKLEELFNRVTLAFEELTDSARRNVYNRKLERARAKAEAKDEKEEPSQPRLTGKTLMERIALGKKYFGMGRHEESAGNGLQAANFYQMALQFEPSNEQYQKAFDREAPFIQRKRADDLYTKAKEAIELTDAAEGIEFLEESLKLNPKKRECYRELMTLYFREKNLPRAKEMGEQAAAMYKKDAGVHATLGSIYLALGLDEPAKKSFKAALSVDKNQEEARQGLDTLKNR